jgi:pimeloyl-ACP methyl ester carboxylesterase
MMAEELQIRVHGDPALPALVYLPGLHGDWTLVSSFRAAVAGRVRFVEFTYPRSLTWIEGDYAGAVEQALLSQGISVGWLLAESFGSVVGWELIRRAQGLSPLSHEARSNGFVPRGLILAGGFVRHPWPWGARWVRRIGENLPMSVYRRLLAGYGLLAKFRHRHAPETLDSISEFIARRTELDRQAMRARLELIAASDPRPVARQVTLPVFYLAGVVDPLVPWPWVRRRLRRDCPGYRTGKTFWLADHNVLATATRPAAETILNWMAVEGMRSASREHPLR